MQTKKSVNISSLKAVWTVFHSVIPGNIKQQGQGTSFSDNRPRTVRNNCRDFDWKMSACEQATENI